RDHIARLNANGSLDTTFDPGLGADASVFAVGVQSDGKVVIGGTFLSVNSFSRNRIARLNADGSLDLTFDPAEGADSDVYAIAIQSDNKTIMGGAFGSLN